MKSGWLLFSAIIASAAAANGEQPGLPPTSDGLWILERHSNIPLFLAPLPKSPEAAAARSDEVLKGPGARREICLSKDLRAKALEQPLMTAGCKLPPLKFENGTAKVDATCGDRSLQSVYVLGPDNHIRTVHVEFVEVGGPDKGGTVDGRFEPPVHATFTVTLNRQENGVHMTDVWDYRWVAPDCGSLKPGESRVLPVQGAK
jgi:hypothetical protein